MRLVVINDNCLFRGEGRGDSTGVIKDRFITMFYGMGEVFGLLF